MGIMFFSFLGNSSPSKWSWSPPRSIVTSLLLSSQHKNFVQNLTIKRGKTTLSHKPRIRSNYTLILIPEIAILLERSKPTSSPLSPNPLIYAVHKYGISSPKSWGWVTIGYRQRISEKVYQKPVWCKKCL